MNAFKNFRIFLAIAISALFIATSCTTVDLYEKTVPIPAQKWKSSFKPVFTFTIKDTTARYQLFLVLRHTEKYSFNNIYVNVYAQIPGQDTAIKIQQDLALASNEKGWFGTGMDDIYELRLPLGEAQPLKAGVYNFTLEQIMREDPLEHVVDAGIRIEKQ
ncbi:MAG TPA: gliding motility lipoprotein GldH [Chitinophagaceae bacterium]